MKQSFTFIAVFIFGITYGQFWIPEGLDIDGAGTSNYSGRSVDINTAGDRVVIGSPYFELGGMSNLPSVGQARVFQWDGTTWFQLGAAIVGGGGTINQVTQYL
ncbi:MAG: hypothetical protein P8L23_03880 [Flavobacteriales bacterium]|nr:hypothetical protein [Flavobacteriales bacterium]